MTGKHFDMVESQDHDPSEIHSTRSMDEAPLQEKNVVAAIVGIIAILVCIVIVIFVFIINVRHDAPDVKSPTQVKDITTLPVPSPKPKSTSDK